MPHDGSAAAAAPPLVALGASPETEQEPTWRRRDDKFLELLLFASNALINAHDASNVLGKTPAQMEQRCSFMFEEIRRVLESLYVETPREWDTEITAAAATAVAPAAAEEEAPGAVLVPDANPVAAAAEVSAAVTVVAGGDGRSGKRPVRKKKKKAEKWTSDEHRFFLAGLDIYRSNWNAMSKEFLTNKTASQIASHHQKYRIREKQREKNKCTRASIHDITEPGSAAIAAAAAVLAARAAAAAQKDELPRAEASARGQDEPLEPVESGGDGLGPVEEFPGADEPGTLLVYRKSKQYMVHI